MSILKYTDGEILDDGGPAFPVVAQVPNAPAGHYYSAPAPHPGMTLRDYFAAQVMQANVGSDASMIHYMREAHNDVPKAYAGLASDSYALADAMLAERAKPRPEVGA